MKTSKYSTYAEIVKSTIATRLGIDNTPTPKQLENIKVLLSRIFDPVREFVKGPLYISSCFRSPALNKEAKGSINSQHCCPGDSAAIDIDCDLFGNGTNKEVFHFIKDNMVFDQLIWEYGDETQPAWVHVSYKNKGENRGMLLRAFRRGGKTVYDRF